MIETFLELKDTFNEVERKRLMSEHTFDFKTKEEYFEYREDWKNRYEELSKKIREAKNARPEFIWKRRPKGITHIKAKTKVGANPKYDPMADWYVFDLKGEARDLLDERKASKIWANIQYLKCKEEEKV